MKSKYFLYLTIFCFAIMSCSKYSASEKKEIKVKVIEMYSKLPPATLAAFANSTISPREWEENKITANRLCIETISKDPVLKEFFNYIFEKSSKKEKKKVTMSNANYTGFGIIELLDKELKLNEADLKKMKVI